MKTTRKTVNKKTGKVYYYQYKDGTWSRTTAQHFERQQYVIKFGKVNKQRLGRYLNESSDISWNSEVLAQINRAQKLGKSYTLNQVISMAQGNQIAITLSNVGASTGQIAQELGVSEDALLDIQNWNPKANGRPSSIFTNPMTGESFELIVNYEGESYFEKVAA